MADTKVSLDEAFKQVLTTLSSHADSIEQIQQSFTLHKIAQSNELQTVQNNVTSTCASKLEVAQLGDEIRSLKEGIIEIKNLFTTHQSSTGRSTNPYLHDTQAPDQTSTPNPPILQHRQFSTGISQDIYNRSTTPAAIIVPPSSAIPTFSGKSTERPRQFLLRIEEYTQTVHQWCRQTLLRGISQYLRGDALEWYCQLHSLQQLPETWELFAARFLKQFQSPIRAIQQEEEWTNCKQLETETINQFVVRLRSLWFEQKPDETEKDFTKHLFCKMRPDVLNLMNFSQSATLENIILEAQKVEEILFLRQKEEHQRNLQTTRSTSINVNNHFSHSSRYNSSQQSKHVPPLMSRRTNYHPSQSLNSSTSTRSWTTYSPSTTITCWRCYEKGHYSNECPLNDTNRDQPLPPRQKND